VIESPVIDRKARRHLATRAEILHAAWDQARAEGVGGISMREIAARIGMRQPSLYTYFPAKHAIYDAMFAQGWQAWVDRLNRLELPADVHAGLRLSLAAFVEFGLEDPARFQLMCERPIPGFTPSPAAYAPAIAALQSLGAILARYGIAASEALDVAVALTTGLVTVQIANDPGGDRWSRLVNDVVDMFLGHFQDAQHGGQS
jgi:AcrR family transcriptional regulator